MFSARSALRRLPTTTASRGRFSQHGGPRRALAAAAAESQQQAGGSGSGGSMPMALVALAGAGYAYYDATDKNTLLEKRVNDLTVTLAGKTNSAFVFLKPHACKGTPGKVEEVLENKFKEAGIRVTDKGEMTAETIDQNMHIDTHYGAIANKAVKQKPSELNVPQKGKEQFQNMFGESWEDAIKAGKVYNAKDAAEKLGVDAAGLNAKWSKLSRGKDLIKFGGGFYCGKVDGIYVMNGFYMDMRAGTSILLLFFIFCGLSVVGFLLRTI